MPCSSNDRLLLWFERTLLPSAEQHIADLRLLLSFQLPLLRLAATPEVPLLTPAILSLIYGDSNDIAYLLDYHEKTLCRLRDARDAFRDDRDLEPLAAALETAVEPLGRTPARTLAALEMLRELHQEDDVFNARVAEVAKNRSTRLDRLVVAPVQYLSKLPTKLGEVESIVRKSRKSRKSRAPSGEVKGLERVVAVTRRLREVAAKIDAAANWAAHEETSSFFAENGRPPVVVDGKAVKMHAADLRVNVLDDTGNVGECRLVMTSRAVLLGQCCARGSAGLVWQRWATTEGMSVMDDEDSSGSSLVIASPRGGRLPRTAQGTAAQRWRLRVLRYAVPGSVDKTGSQAAAAARKALRFVASNSSQPLLSPPSSSASSWLPSRRLDTRARLRCAALVAFFVVIYAAGALNCLQAPAGELVDGLCRSTAPRGMIPALANFQLKLFGYALPFFSVELLHWAAVSGPLELQHDRVDGQTKQWAKQARRDVVLWVYVWLLARLVIEPAANVVCPLVTFGQHSLTHGSGKQGVASHKIMTLIAWAVAALVADSAWLSPSYWARRTPLRRRVALGAFVLLAYELGLYSWMAWVTGRHFHSWQDLVAAAGVVFVVLLGVTRVYDAVDLVSDHNGWRPRATASAGAAGARSPRLTAGAKSARLVLLLQRLFPLVFQVVALGVAVLALALLALRWKLGMPSARLRSQFWVFLPASTAWAGTALGSFGLYRTHGHLVAAAYAPLWVAVGTLLYVLAHSAWITFGLRGAGAALLGLRGGETSLSVGEAGWGDDDRFALMLFLVLGACKIQARQIAVTVFRPTAGAGTVPQDGATSVWSVARREVGRAAKAISLLAYFLSFLQLLGLCYGHVVRAAEAAAWQGGTTGAAVALLPGLTAVLLALALDKPLRDGLDVAKIFECERRAQAQAGDAAEQAGVGTLALLARLFCATRAAVPGLGLTAMRAVSAGWLLFVFSLFVRGDAMVGVACGVTLPLLLALDVGREHCCGRLEGKKKTG